MKTTKVQPVVDAKTAPPDKNKSYVAVQRPDGTQQWVLVATEAGDGVTEKDYDFDQGKKWAAEQKKGARSK